MQNSFDDSVISGFSTPPKGNEKSKHSFSRSTSEARVVSLSSKEQVIRGYMFSEFLRALKTLNRKWQALKIPNSEKEITYTD